MKRAVSIIVLLLVLSFSVIGCSSPPQTDVKVETETDAKSEVKETENHAESEESKGIEVDKNLLTVDITVPASFYEGQTDEEILAAVADKGYSKTVINEDGSVTFSMTKAQHTANLKEMLGVIDESIDEMLNNGEVKSFKSITYNNNLTEFEVLVDPELYTNWDNLYAWGLQMLGGFYQSFSGVNSDDIGVVVKFIDENTKEVVETLDSKEMFSDDTTTTEPTSNTSKLKDSPFIEANQLKTIEDVSEFSLESFQLTKQVKPPTEGTFYTYYGAEEGKTYVDITITYKNLRDSAIEADKVFSGELWFANKYNYNGFTVIENDGRQDFTYVNITQISPLSQEFLHLLVEIPDEVAQSDGKLVATLNFDGEYYNVLIRDGSEGEVLAPFPDSKMKADGNLKANEKLAVPNKHEFWVEYANISKKIDPPKPGDFHTYYEADDGKVYVDFCLAYKNWTTHGVSADDVVKAELKYADKYNYSGFSIIEQESRTDFTYSNITRIPPLSVEYIHYLFEVPDEVENSSESIIITFSIGDNEYSYTVR